MPINDMLGAFSDRRQARVEQRQQRRANDPPRVPAPPTAAAPAAAPVPLPAGANAPGQQPYQQFYQTPLYQFPLQQGLQGVNAYWAGRGMLESGAAEKSLNDYAAGMASGGLRDYFSLLGNQQALGFNAALGQAGAAQNYGNSIAGANQNYANSLTGLNSSFANNASNLTSGFANAASQGAQGLGNAYGQGAMNTGNIMSNAIMANANNTNSMIGGIGSALGNAAGYFAYQPYAGGAPTNLLAGTPYG